MRYLAGALLLLWTARAFCADDAFLEPFRKKFSEEMEVFERVKTDRKGAAEYRYVRMIRAMIVYMEKTEDEFGLRPAKKELERFEKDRTVPREPPLGTPELMVKAATKYYEIIDGGEQALAKERDATINKFLHGLKTLERQLKSRKRLEQAALVTKEIARINDLMSDGGEANDAEKLLELPKKYAGHLALAYTFVERKGRLIRDLSGKRQHGDLLGAEQIDDPSEGICYAFVGDNAMMEAKDVTLGSSWTLVTRVRFPLGKSSQSRVLLSSGFKQHHVAVDPSGELGVEDGGFVSSGYNVNSLRGWHELAAVASYKKTTFFIDGKPVGVARAVCAKPVNAIGNSAAGGRPLKGGLGTLILWRSAWSLNEVNTLYQHRYGQKP